MYSNCRVLLYGIAALVSLARNDGLGGACHCEEGNARRGNLLRRARIIRLHVIG